MNARLPDGAIISIVEELRTRAGISATDEVVRCVCSSVADLQGSTSRESLPEMAYRLTLVRLADLAELGQRAVRAELVGAASG